MKTFTLRLGRTSFKNTFDRVKRAVKTGIPDIREDEMTCDSVESMMTVVSRSKLEVFAAIVEKQPNTLKELAEFLGKDIGNISRDVKGLELLGIVELKENESDRRELRPVAKYSQITFDFHVPAQRKAGGSTK